MNWIGKMALLANNNDIPALRREGFFVIEYWTRDTTKLQGWLDDSKITENEFFENFKFVAKNQYQNQGNEVEITLCIKPLMKKIPEHEDTEAKAKAIFAARAEGEQAQGGGEI